jgi:pimeloyl-ACP methyl ester carboxylesterase
MKGENHFESRFFHYSGGIPIHYEAVGRGPVPIVFLHGFASAHDTWLDMAALFPSDRFTLYLLDLKGFGLSAKPGDGAYSVKDQAAMVRDFIQELGLQSLILIGHSLGGTIALRVCLDAQRGEEPFTVRKLVLIDCAAYPQRLPKFFRRLRSPFLGPLLLRLIPARRMVRMTLEKVFYNAAAVTPERIERYARYFRGKGVPYALRATVKCIDPTDYAHISESYRGLSVPTLIIWGKEDHIIKPKNAFRLHDDIPGSQLKVFKKCGHNPHEERPEETYAAISAFLDAEETPAPSAHH